MTPQMVKCNSCQSQNPADARFCENCGAPLPVPTPTFIPPAPGYPPNASQPGLIQTSNPPKDPTLALVMSLIFLGGGGQIYLGQTLKGIAIIVVNLVLTFLIVGFPLWLLGVMDAFLLAKRLQERHPIGEWEFFWNKPKN